MIRVVLRRSSSDWFNAVPVGSYVTPEEYAAYSSRTIFVRAGYTLDLSEETDIGFSYNDIVGKTIGEIRYLFPAESDADFKQLTVFTSNNNAFNITGSGDLETIVTGAGNDVINDGQIIQGGGYGYSDLLIGGAGDDIYYVYSTDTEVSEGVYEDGRLNRAIDAGGNDTVYAFTDWFIRSGEAIENLVLTGGIGYGAGNELANTIIVRGSNDAVIFGNEGADNLIGSYGNDTLDGGGDVDRMEGNRGNDTYVVDNVGDTIFEVFAGGVDSVETTLSSYGLSKALENLAYTGSGSFTGTGSVYANRITSGSGNDTLDGGSGADTLVGGAGNDTYVVDNLGDLVTELADGGVDTIQSRVSLTLADNVENLTLLTTASMDGTGNGLDNAVTGNAGLNVLDGYAGRDTLTGLGNNDTFLFRAGQANGDIVTDFTGAGPGKGDILKFVGFGAGTLVHSTDTSHPDWYVIIPDAAHGGPAAAETIQITGVTNLDVLIGGTHNDILFA